MGITLFSHNEQAYREASAMLAETGRAAVIHPTGTGKSFIAFKLCEDHPDRTVCWCSPSAYIFQTQKENFLAAGGSLPENIRFNTYARLMLMDKDSLAALRPDYIVLDEFHRCGAEMWGKGVKTLLSLYPEVPVLGLSATSIRYLDNQRDMAEELFEGNVASEMTLGEAIARGILAAPKYIISVYAYQKELVRYENRVRSMKNDAARGQAERYLEALRRTLDKADGLDEVFARHITDRCGKYLVFCAGVRQMKELLSCCGAWFHKVDANPHIYSAYSENPQASEAYAAFKADQSAHLKLLFCIDMFNEGIHVEGLAGVILFRPTVSPIIYKQQIGRALSASGNPEPVIFDVVNNFENLYSIGVIEEELAQAAACYQQTGGGKPLVRERFQIIDEVRESRELFEALNETLSAPWEVMFERAREYYQAHGNLNVPKRFRTKEGYPLGTWITTQRRVRAGRQYGTLTPARIARLDGIGMVWENRLELAWERGYRAARTYYEEQGNLLADAGYVNADGYPLGVWLGNQRSLLARNMLPSGRRERLEEIGMVWRKADYLWEERLQAAQGYYREFGNLCVQADYQTPEGLPLGKWIAAQRQYRRQGRLSDRQIRRLDEIGMIWEDAYTRQWEYGYGQAVKWYEAHGNLEVPAAYVDADGFALGRWLRRHTEEDPKTGRPAVCVTPERRAKLDALGMRWERADPWETRYQLARRYYEEHGDLHVPAGYVVEGVWLHKWLNEQKQIYQGNRAGKTLRAGQIARLEEIGMTWRSKSEETWALRYEGARQFYREHGHLHVPGGYVSGDGKRLDLWLRSQRQAWRNGRLSERQRALLEKLGMEETQAEPDGDAGEEARAARTIA